MLIFDKNQTLQPPNGDAEFVTPIGSYLMLQYRDWDKGVQTAVYLNDQGREVIRTTTRVDTRAEADEQQRTIIAETQDEIAEVEAEATMRLNQIVSQPRPPVGRRDRLAAGFWLMLEGIAEMSRAFFANKSAVRGEVR